MASRKSKDKRAKQEKPSNPTDTEPCWSPGAAAEADWGLDVELTELMKEMTLVGSKTGNAKAVLDGGVRHIPRSVLYFGWFFGETVSSALKNYASDFLQKCISEVPNFEDFVEGTCQGIDIIEYFKKPKSSTKNLTYHITAKFCDRKSDELYEDKAANHIGKVFDIHIIGIFITRSTIGYRVEMQQDQMELFYAERKRETRRHANSSSPDLSPQASPLRAAAVPENKRPCKSATANSKQQSKKDSDLEIQREHSDYPGLAFVKQTINLQPTTTRAHMTLGCAPKVKAFRAGEDLLDIIDLERQAAAKLSDTFAKSFDIKGIHPPNALRQFGRQHGDAFVIYFGHKIVAKAVFMAYA